MEISLLMVLKTNSVHTFFAKLTQDLIYFSDSSIAEDVGGEGLSGSNQVCCYALNSARSFFWPL